MYVMYKAHQLSNETNDVKHFIRNLIINPFYLFLKFFP